MKPTTISIASIAGMLGVVAAIGFAQPDGLQPPAGPVDDTQPSLASISQQVADLAGTAYPPSLRFSFESGIGGNQQNENRTLIPESEGSFVRIVSVSTIGPGATMNVGATEENVMAIEGATERNLYGLRVPTPVCFRVAGVNASSGVTVLYWVEGANQ